MHIWSISAVLLMYVYNYCYCYYCYYIQRTFFLSDNTHTHTHAFLGRGLSLVRRLRVFVSTGICFSFKTTRINSRTQIMRPNFCRLLITVGTGYTNQNKVLLQIFSRIINNRENSPGKRADVHNKEQRKLNR